MFETSKLKNIFKALETVLTDGSHWFDGKPFSDAAKLICVERDKLSQKFADIKKEQHPNNIITKGIYQMALISKSLYYPALLMDNIDSIEDTYKKGIIDYFSSLDWKKVAPNLSKGIVAEGQNKSNIESKLFEVTYNLLRFIETAKLPAEPKKIAKTKLEEIYLKEPFSFNNWEAFFIYHAYENTKSMKKYLPSWPTRFKRNLINHHNQTIPLSMTHIIKPILLPTQKNYQRD